MSKPSTFTPDMKKSIEYFENQGKFFEALRKILTEDKLEPLCRALGIYDESLQSTYEFMFFLQTHNFVEEIIIMQKGLLIGQPQKLVHSRDAQILKNAAIQCNYNDIIIICNKWMGLDEHDGIVQQVPTNNESFESEILSILGKAGYEIFPTGILYRRSDPSLVEFIPWNKIKKIQMDQRNYLILELWLAGECIYQFDISLKQKGDAVNVYNYLVNKFVEFAKNNSQ